MRGYHALTPKHAAAEPFWQRLGRFAAFPLRGEAMWMLLVLTVCGISAYFPGLGWLFSLVTYFAGYKYAFEILLHTADGRDGAPPFNLHAENRMAWRMLAVQIALVVAIKLLLWLQATGWALAALALAALMQPSLILSLARNDDFVDANNPFKAFGLLLRIGPASLLASLVLFLIQAIAFGIAARIVHATPGFVAAVVVDAVFYWGLFATFHFLGYVLLQYHVELGFSPQMLRERIPTQQDRDQELLDRADVLVENGDVDAALMLLREHIDTRAVTLAVHERCRQLLLRKGDATALQAQRGEYINALASAGEDRRALGLLREALDADADFVPRDLDHGERLAQRALQLGQNRLALDTWQALIRNYPKDRDVGAWALGAAQLLHERFDDDAQARALLLAARPHCDDALQVGRIDALLKLLA